MAFHDTKKNNGYHSLFTKLFGHVWGGAFFPETVYFQYTFKDISFLFLCHLIDSSSSASVASCMELYKFEYYYFELC